MTPTGDSDPSVRHDPAQDDSEHRPGEHGAAPTGKQMAYLRALAQRTGQTFAYPHTAGQASAEIRRLKALAPSTRTERAIERRDDRAAREAAEDAVEIHRFEIVGYGASATWRQRS